MQNLAINKTSVASKGALILSVVFYSIAFYTAIGAMDEELKPHSILTGLLLSGFFTGIWQYLNNRQFKTVKGLHKGVAIGFILLSTVVTAGMANELWDIANDESLTTPAVLWVLLLEIVFFVIATIGVIGTTKK